MHMNTYALRDMRRPEEISVELVFSFRLSGEFKDQIQGARLVRQTPFPAESSCWLLFQPFKKSPVTHPSHRLLLCVFLFSCLRFSFVGLNLCAAKLSPM